MAEHNITGVKGEELALEYLLKKGYILVEKSWRFKHKEVDIIMKDEDVLVFVEVKTRSDDYFGNPEEFVNKRKQKYLIQAAEYFIEAIGFEGQSRFDIISVLILPENDIKIEHFKEAFYP